MKKSLLVITGFIFSLSIMAQGHSADKGKGKEKSKNKISVNPNNRDEVAKAKKEKDEHDKKVWEGTTGKKGKGPKLSKNQPARVRAAFQRDYPNATNVSWSKYRGDWTATFGNGVFMSTALYHANGDRKDTRTPVTRNEVPGNVLDSVFKRRPGTWLGDIIKIEMPNVINDIFRIKNNMQGEPGYLYYNSDGKLVKYIY